jgi:hypothetical protein
VTCQASGDFSAGSCDAIPCQPMTIEHTQEGSTTCRGSTTDTCPYTCADGYSDTGARPGQAVCQASAQFTTARCVAVRCPDLLIQTSSSTTKTCSAQTDGSCAYTCADGYQDSARGSVSCVGVSVGAGQPARSEFSPAVVACSAVQCPPVTIHHTAGTALAGVDKVCTGRTDDPSCPYKCADGHKDSLSSFAWNNPSYSGSTIACKGVPVADGSPARSEFQPPPLQAATCDPLACTPISIEHTTDPSGRTSCTGRTGDSCTLAAPVPNGHADYTCAPGYTASRATRTVLCKPNLAEQSAFEQPDAQPTEYPRPDLWDYCPRECLTCRGQSS